MVDMASLLRAQLAHARLCPASEHPELPPATATALHTRPQSPRVTRRLQLRSTSTFPLSLSACALFLCHFRIHLSCHPRCARVCHVYATGSHPLRRIRRRRRLCQDCLRKLSGSTSAQLSSGPLRRAGLSREPHHTHRDTQIMFIYFASYLTTLRIIHNICRDPRDPR